jgi:hypothetical protein
MPHLSNIDTQIFSADSAFDKQDEIYNWLEDQIEHFVSHIRLDDRCFFTHLEVMLATLWCLSSQFGNSVTKHEKVIQWEKLGLEAFDYLTSQIGDADKVTNWRTNIVKNFERLKHTLATQQ